MKNYLGSKNKKIALDDSLITQRKKQLGLNEIKNINKYLKTLVETEIYEANKLSVPIFYTNTNDNQIIIKSNTFSYFLKNFSNLKKQDDNTPFNEGEADESEEANSDDFNNDDE